ncbi:hypothetical protein HYFRA_00000097 [Hymenoscyphus fraxineus]|uniref:2EXR domain-containing protein n=1 Tax=Hymenoscyphus fraxineus TaxID=746836 RepID=A0A9N9L283_9HELO|nr:hypothetical protein HYFRA_00000097 [Hymenoscyphus fraxineus]
MATPGPKANHLSRLINLSIAPSSQPLTKFTLFPELPTEIQLRIWGFASPPAYYLVCKDNHTWIPTPTLKRLYYYSRPVPAVLQVCQQSREEFLHQDGVQKDHPTYKLYHNIVNCQSARPVYISMEQDIVQALRVSLLTQPELQPLQHIYFHHTFMDKHPIDNFLRADYDFSHFANLKKLYYDLGTVKCKSDAAVLKARLERGGNITTPAVIVLGRNNTRPKFRGSGIEYLNHEVKEKHEYLIEETCLDPYHMWWARRKV